MRRWLFGLIGLCLGALAIGDAPAQHGETRIALIIANEAYTSLNLGRLPGTQRDAAAMQAALQSVGFSVAVRANLSREQMRAELSRFARDLRALGQSGVGFLYFSGHGIADGPRGQNYLVPVDAQIADVTDLPTNALPMNEELDAIELAGARATIVVIDACRNTLVSIGRSGARGLAPVPVRTDTLVAFSTQANATASDDGLYAQSLASELVQPGADAVTVFARVTSRVASATSRRQIPRYDNGLIEPIVFVSQASPSSGVAADPAALALRALDQVSTRDWSVLGGQALVRNVLSTATWVSLEAASASDARAQTVLGMATLRGIGTEVNEAEAVRLFRQAADRGFTRAQVSLGYMYYYGRGTAQNLAEAVRLFRLAANQGSAAGQASLGSAYAQGQGVPQDPVEAVRLFRLAASQGSVAAQARLGEMYWHGDGISKNEAEAVRLFRLSADQGDPDGQALLAQVYESGGGGLIANRAEAVRLYRLAAQQGESTAQASLRRLGEQW